MRAIAYTQAGLPIDDPQALIDLDLPCPSRARATCGWRCARWR